MDPRNGTLPTHHPNFKFPRNSARGKKGVVNFLCPFGCMDNRRVNEQGYCRHLAGFATGEFGRKPPEGNDFEVREKIDIDKERVGHIVDAILRTDKLVPMRGESWRVYRKGGRYPMLPDATSRIKPRSDEIADGLDDEDFDIDPETDDEDAATAEFIEAEARAEEAKKARIEQVRVKFLGRAAAVTPVNPPKAETPAPPV
jgi:hypothetical protein